MSNRLRRELSSSIFESSLLNKSDIDSVCFASLASIDITIVSHYIYYTDYDLQMILNLFLDPFLARVHVVK